MAHSRARLKTIAFQSRTAHSQNVVAHSQKRQLRRSTIFLTFLAFCACCYGQGQKQTTEENHKNMSIDEILQMEDPTSAIIELDDRVNELSDYGEDLSKLTEPQKVLLFVENLEREVNNGGFHQFYFNSSGDYAHETLDALKTIGANKMADILTKANSVWPNQQVPKDRTKRENIQETIEEQAAPVWDECDNVFYAYPDDIAGLLLKYVKQHKADFE